MHGALQVALDAAMRRGVARVPGHQPGDSQRTEGNGAAHRNGALHHSSDVDGRLVHTSKAQQRTTIVIAHRSVPVSVRLLSNCISRMVPARHYVDASPCAVAVGKLKCALRIKFDATVLLLCINFKVSLPCFMHGALAGCQPSRQRIA